MEKHEVRGWIEETGVIASIRMSTKDDALFAADAVVHGGIPVVEIALDMPQAMAVISLVAKHIHGVVIGAGGVIDAESARQCLDAGAQFLTSEGFDPGVIELGAKQNVVVIPGALTPTEVRAAWETNSDFVKIFPCIQIGGSAYIKSLREMFSHIPLIASGGVNQLNASDLILAGAVAIGVGRELIPREAIRLRQSGRIRELARRFLDFVRSGRAHSAAHRTGQPVLR
jgi:2-dehydro-3-deoxyphosphogluconate aldolase/(4S)-4-hydroxy-2-oxoglutarate aldolase